MNCPVCNNTVRENEIYCSECGEKVNDIPSDFPIASSEGVPFDTEVNFTKPKKSKVKIFVIILISLIAVAICGISSFFAFNYLMSFNSPEYIMGSGYNKLPPISYNDDIRCEKIIYVSPDNILKDMLGIEDDAPDTAYMIFVLQTDDDDIGAFCSAGNRIFSSHSVQHTGGASLITIPMKNFNVSEFDGSLVRFAIKDDNKFYKVELKAEPLSMNSFFDLFTGGGFPSFPGEGFDITDIM